MTLAAVWRDHSLTILCFVGGVIGIALAWCFDAGKLFDTVLGLGQGLLTVALFYSLAGSFRERNKPET
jgi:hypothetical protein